MPIMKKIEIGRYIGHSNISVYHTFRDANRWEHRVAGENLLQLRGTTNVVFLKMISSTYLYIYPKRVKRFCLFHVCQNKCLTSRDEDNIIQEITRCKNMSHWIFINLIGDLFSSQKGEMVIERWGVCNLSSHLCVHELRRHFVVR